MVKSVFWGLGLVLVGFIISWIYQTIKAMKDPDVQTASKLRMSVKRYRKYQRLYDAHWEIMMKYGPNSKEAERFFANEVYPNLPNPNEWRRYEDYRTVLQQQEIMSQIQNPPTKEWQPTSLSKAMESMGYRKTQNK